MSFFKSQKAISLDVLDEEADPFVGEEEEAELPPPSPPKKKKKKKQKVSEGDDDCITIKRPKKQKQSKEHNDKGKTKHIEKKVKGKEKDKDLAFLDSITLPSDANYIVFPDTSPAEEDSKRMELEISLKRLKYQMNQIKNLEPPPEINRDNEEVTTIKDPTIIDLKLQDAKGREQYKLSVYRDAPLTKLLDTLKNLVCHPDITLTFDGIIVDPEQTPKDYGMYSNNIIYFRTGSEKNSLPSKTSVHNIKKANTSENHNSNSNLQNPSKKRKAIVVEEEDEEEPVLVTKPPLKKISLEEVGAEVEAEVEKAIPEKDVPENNEEDDEAALERELEEKLSKKAEKEKQDAEENKKNTIKLVVRTAGGADFKFRIKRTDPISKLIEAAATNQRVSPSTLTLKFEGETLKPTKTPEHYDLENDDLLDLFKNDRCK